MINLIKKFLYLHIILFLTICFFPFFVCATEYYDVQTADWKDIELIENLEYIVAQNETSELILLRSHEQEMLKVRFQVPPEIRDSVSISSFYLHDGSDGNINIDALVPTETFHKDNNLNSKNSHIIVLKLEFLNSLPLGRYQFDLSLIQNDAKFDGFTFHLNSTSLYLDDSDFLLQGNLLFKTKNVEKIHLFKLIERIDKFGFTSIVMPSIWRDFSGNKDTLNFAMNKIENFRISPSLMLSRKKTLTDVASKVGMNKTDWISEEINNIEHRLSKIASNELSGFESITYKLWDEPVEDNYQEVTLGYETIKKNIPDLTLELSEEPSIKLGNIADIWVVHIERLQQSVIDLAKEWEDELVLYANKSHDISQDPFHIRNLGWLLGYYDIDGYHFWSVSNWSNGKLNQNSSDKHSNIRGTLFYFNDKTRELYNSLRMEVFYQGIEDMKLIKAVKLCANSRIDHKIGKTAFSLVQQLGIEIDSWLKSYPTKLPRLYKNRDDFFRTAIACEKFE